MDQVEKHFETNVFGLVQATKAALPSLRKREGRVINVSSVAGKVTGQFWGPYAASKHAVEAVSDALRMELLDDPVDVVIIEPGAVRTGFNEEGALNLEQYLPGSRYADRYKSKLSQTFGGITPEKASKKVVKAVETSRPSARYTITPEAWFLPKLKLLIPTWLWDRLARWYEG